MLRIYICLSFFVQGRFCKLIHAFCMTHGLSPPTRGNLESILGRTIVEGSIPAYAGKPDHNKARYLMTVVYPRLRGETCACLVYQFQYEGLSPPTRGNPIPAYAGKPYPRLRGETVQRQVTVATVVAMEEAPFLVPVQRVVGRIKVEPELPRSSAWDSTKRSINSSSNASRCATMRL